tara:strand:- start:823 stop:1053 length:231 start_codon:yes stop_codon:yes gene_type:complete
MSKDKGKPEYGVEYRLTGGKDVKSIAGGNTWEESRVKGLGTYIDPDLDKLIEEPSEFYKKYNPAAMLFGEVWEEKK